MKRFTYILSIFFLTIVVKAHAQGGCDDTPENPTLILAGLASGVYGANMLRTRLCARRKGQERV